MRYRRNVDVSSDMVRLPLFKAGRPFLGIGSLLEPLSLGRHGNRRGRDRLDRNGRFGLRLHGARHGNGPPAAAVEETELTLAGPVHFYEAIQEPPAGRGWVVVAP